MPVSIDSFASIHHLEVFSVRLLKSPSNRIALCFIEEIILNHKVEMGRSGLCKNLADCLICLVLYVEEVVELSFAAVAAEEENGEKKEDYCGDEEIETSVAERFGAAADDIDF